MAALIVRRGASVETVPLASAEVSIGRDPANTLALPTEDTVSKHHARLAYQAGMWSIADVGSTNGTFVNETRTTYQQLTTGDEIRVGAVRMTFQSDSATEPTAPIPADTSINEHTILEHPVPYLDGGDEWQHPSDTAAEAGPQPRPLPRTGPEEQPPLTEPPVDAPQGPRNPSSTTADRERPEGGRVVVRGLARNVQIRAEENNNGSSLSFRVDGYDQSGNRLPAVSVYVKWYRRGQVSEGEQVEAEGVWRRGMLQAMKVHNVTTGADIVQGLSHGEKVAMAVFLIIFGSIVLLIFTMIALGVLTGIFAS